MLNYLTTYDDNELTVKVLSCDSISQVKSKLLDAAFVGVHYSERPHPEDVDLGKFTSRYLAFSVTFLSSCETI